MTGETPWSQDKADAVEGEPSGEGPVHEWACMVPSDKVDAVERRLTSESLHPRFELKEGADLWVPMSWIEEHLLPELAKTSNDYLPEEFTPEAIKTIQDMVNADEAAEIGG